MHQINQVNPGNKPLQNVFVVQKNKLQESGKIMHVIKVSSS